MSQSASYTPINEPPVYDPNGSSTQEPRDFNDNLPADFKYSTSVASCDIEIRHVFIRKVYSLLSAQLFITFLTGTLIYFNPNLRDWCLENSWLLVVSMIGSIVFMGLAYWKSRSYPYNLMLLAAFTVFESYGVGIVTSLYDTNIVLQAILMTTILFIGLTAYSLQTKYDFSNWETYVSVAFLGLFSVTFVFLFIPHNSTVELVYSFFGAAIFSAFIMIDTQNIMKRFHPEEEIAATITLYLDIINLFMYILRILSSSQNNDH
ncbi:hypothetical protein PACTADRAFT_48650 [Pachysolen tannophilus NRRL Y-2460]|uniref:Uncharacterized protein n=1 Tax=Pachysolen tannophilus NRRL Y-2460 TaxID=669874 RepID=A0A1E4TYK2_PACTA|nr:hypothetical protein PACTADRAFT_48650 [Pachysolen tannophilus NRRL Y-2460]